MKPVSSRLLATLSLAFAVIGGLSLASGARAEAPPAPPVTPKAAPADAGSEAAAAMDRELRTVEEDVAHLKERVFRSKATLEMLKELVIEGVGIGSRVSIWHVNNFGGAYSIEAAQYWFDGKSVFTKTEADENLDALTEVEVYQGSVNPGKHQLQVSLALKGKGYKVFSYLESYQFRLQSQYEFLVDEGKTATVRVMARSRSGLRSFTDRPTIEFAEQAGSME